MKHIILFLALMLPVAASSQSSTPQKPIDVGRDTLDAATDWYTFAIDSTWNINTHAWRYDTTFYGDTRAKIPGKSVYPLEVYVQSTGSTDTLIVKELRLGKRYANNVYDSTWQLVQIWNLMTNQADTIVVVKNGPYKSHRGQWYRTARFVILSPNADAHIWRIERRSGKSHPYYPDASKTHLLIMEFMRGGK